MQGRCACFEFYAVLLTLVQDLRFLQFDLVHSGHNDAITERFHLLHCRLKFLDFVPTLAKCFKLGKQIEIVLYIYTALRACDLEKHSVFGLHIHLHSSLARIDTD